MRATYYYILIMKLKSQEKIGSIAGKSRNEIIIDCKVDQFYDLFVVY